MLPTFPSIRMNSIVNKQTNYKNDHIKSEIRIGWRMAGLGMEVSSTFAAGALLGWAFDQWKGTTPKDILAGSIIGIIVGMWVLIQGALKMNRMLDKNHPTLGRGKPLVPDLDEDRSDEKDTDYD